MKPGFHGSHLPVEPGWWVHVPEDERTCDAVRFHGHVAGQANLGAMRPNEPRLSRSVTPGIPWGFWLPMGCDHLIDFGNRGFEIERPRKAIRHARPRACSARQPRLVDMFIRVEVPQKGIRVMLGPKDRYYRNGYYSPRNPGPPPFAPCSHNRSI